MSLHSRALHRFNTTHSNYFDAVSCKVGYDGAVSASLETHKADGTRYYLSGKIKVKYYTEETVLDTG
jgi:hypothetical protein